MTSEREAELLAHVPTLASMAELTSFRHAIREQGEELTTNLYAALIRRQDVLAKREGKA